jgi:hypothetical protein
MFQRILGACLIGAGLLAGVVYERAASQVKKPSTPPGRDPGGVAVAVICAGLDYTVPDVARRLARDGEGELIGWDMADRDRRPFDTAGGNASAVLGGDCTLIASLLLKSDAVRLVPVRIDPSDPVSLARALAFIAQTPARIAVLPISDSGSPGMWDWTSFHQAALRFNATLLVIPGGPPSSYPATLGLNNALAVEHGTAIADAAGFGGRIRQVSGAPLATAEAARAAADLLAREPGLDGASLKLRLGMVDGGQVWQARK